MAVRKWFDNNVDSKSLLKLGDAWRLHGDCIRSCMMYVNEAMNAKTEFLDGLSSLPIPAEKRCDT